MKSIPSAKRRRGSAAVTVLLMTVILITLGLSFVLVSKTNSNLSEKSRAWLIDYYRLESVMNEDLSLLEDELRARFSNLSSLQGSDLDELREDLSVRLHSELELEASDSALRSYLLLETASFQDEPFAHAFSILCTVSYHPADGRFIIEAKEEIPPDFKYDSLY